ncbi:MAG: ABC transporter ATP-binding protein/permease [Clostridiales Family XIII bacterium]|jgi:ATP-binding cassette subfamily B protein|nr:ABC transporter ATP-binding protein/permease [Clostridiales Family XIII bacterium]
MLRLYRQIEPFIGALALAVALLYGQAMCDLALPDYMADIVNKGIMRGDSPFIVRTGLVMLLVSLLGAACSISVGFISARVAAGLGRRLRKDVFGKVVGFSNAEFDKFTTSSLITRTTNDITQIQMMLVFVIRLLFYAPIIGVGGILHAIATDAGMSWIIILAIGVILVLIVVVLFVAMPKFKIVQTLVDKLNRVVRENLDGMPVVRAFSTQAFEEKRFDAVNAELTGVNLFINRLMSIMMPTMMVVMNLVTVLIIWVGSNQVSSFRMDVGSMMAYMQYVMQVMMAFLMMSMMFILLPRASVSANRIADVLEADATVTDRVPSPLPAKRGVSAWRGRKKATAVGDAAPPRMEPGQEGRLEFDDVSFAYPDAEENVLYRVSFTAMPGTTTAIIGSTGSGKSTVINLIPRFYDVSGGRILLNGVDVRELGLKELRSQLGYVPQKSVLFTGTIRSNIAFSGADASDEDLWLAADISQAREFIDAKPDGLDTEVAQGGTNVSGGQRQRLSIARALARKPQFYLFDDSFSALDFKTDAALRAALRRETGDSTVILVTQRVNTAMAAERIIVLDNGRIVGNGSHRELLEGCDIYKEIAYSQLSKEDLA